MHLHLGWKLNLKFTKIGLKIMGYGGVYVKPRHAKPTIHLYCKKVFCANPAEKTNKLWAIQSTICSVKLCQIQLSYSPFLFSTGKH